MRRCRLAFVVAMTGALATSGCGATPLTPVRLETALSATFANLVPLQLQRLGLPPAQASEVKVVASCLKLPATGAPAGSGTWQCTLDWHGSNARQLRDTYDVWVSTDGCYAATIEGAESQVGGPTLAGPDGTSRRNLLYSFEGCFDTT